MPRRNPESERLRKANYAKQKRKSGSDIGKIPPVRKKKLREACSRDLHLWHHEVFTKSNGFKRFGDVQRASIDVSQTVITHGGRTQKMEPRGYVKSTRLAQEALWAILYGHRSYATIFSASKDLADDMLDGIKFELLENDVLFDMFPEVCYPIRKLEGRHQQALTQHVDGEPTHLRWLKNRIELSHVNNPLSAGSIIAVRAIRNARGLVRRIKKKGAKRPDLILLDDIQTDADAMSKTAIRTLLKLIRKSILRLGGHSSTLAVMMACTCMEPDDVPDQIAADPSWVTVRYQMLESMPTNLDWWVNDYADVRTAYKEGDIEGQRKAHAKATALYKKNRRMADAGAKPTWKWAYAWDDPEASEISAIQHAMNILIDDGEEAFWAECQNKPKRQAIASTSVKAKREDLEASIISIPRGVVPVEATRLVSFSDVHKNLLYWAVLAAGPGLRHIVDYGTWPSQSDLYFSLESAKKTIPDLFPKLSMKQAVQKACDVCSTELMAKTWKGQNSAPFPINLKAIDCNWGPTEKNVKKAIRNHLHKANLLASHGRAVPARDRHMDEWTRKPGEEKGPAWIRKKQTSKAVAMIMFDTNDWKTNTHIALATPNESEETLTIFEHDERERELLFDHLLSENDAVVKSRREINEWKLAPNEENHFFDCIVGCMVLASVELEGKQIKTPGKRTRFRF